MTSGLATATAAAIPARYAAQVDLDMAAVVTEELGDTWLHDAVGYHLGWLDADFRPPPGENGGRGGKKLRPALALLCYQGALESQRPGAGGAADLEAVLPLASGLELLHGYSLVHDDIEDGDRSRRGRPTLWTLAGKPRAINAGDCLHALAFRCVCRLGQRGFDPPVVNEVLAAVTRASIELTLGQDDDISFEDGHDVDLDMYLRMISGKTAALMGCATSCGALLAIDRSHPRRPDILAAYAELGHQLGLAFQICDDILGIWGREADTGKPSGSDIRRRKKSLPVVFALQTATGPSHDRLRELYLDSAPVTADDEAFVRSVLDDCKARQFAEQAAQAHKQRAVSALTLAAGGPDALADNGFLVQLEELAGFLADRTY